MEILTQALRKEHREAGLTLSEDGYSICLERSGKVLKTFPAYVTIKSIWDEADRQLKKGK